MMSVFLALCSVSAITRSRFELHRTVALIPGIRVSELETVVFRQLTNDDSEIGVVDSWLSLMTSSCFALAW